jgi:putative CocE/NonD family hydrolase
MMTFNEETASAGRNAAASGIRRLLVIAALAAMTWQAPAVRAGTLDPMFAKWHVAPQFDFSQPQEIKPRWARRLTGYLAAGGGVELRYSVLLPPGKGPFPVIINYSGYDPGAIGGYAYRHDDTAMSTSLDQTLLEHGYAVMGVNAPGTGCSTGKFDFLGASYGRDGAAAVEWAARQSWSDGDVGMANWSWAGMSQVATAEYRPPHLKAIAPGMVMTDPRLGSWDMGGIPSPGFVTGWWQFLHSRWLAVRRSAVAANDSRCIVQVDRNYAAAQDPAVNLTSQLLRHPLRDHWIDQRTILNGVGRIDVPVLSMEAFQDEIVPPRGIYYQRLLDPRKVWLVQTNGDHDLYDSVRFRATLLRFLDHFVKGKHDGWTRGPHVRVWMEAKSDSSNPLLHEEDAVPGWVVRLSRYPVKVGTLTLTLGGDHRLDEGGKAEGPPDSYRYPVPGPAVNADPVHFAWGPLGADWRPGGVWYTSPALKKTIVIYGPVSANLWVSTTQSDTDLQVTLTDVRPDGEEQYVQRGWLRLSDRALDTQRSTTHHPVLCDLPRCIAAVTPGVPVLARVELTQVAQAFRAGDRIRIWIGTPSATGANGFDYSSLPSTDQIWHDARHRSQIVFGVLSGVRPPPARPACGTVLMQPCRRDPLRRHRPGAIQLRQ